MEAFPNRYRSSCWFFFQIAGKVAADFKLSFGFVGFLRTLPAPLAIRATASTEGIAARFIGAGYQIKEHNRIWHDHAVPDVVECGADTFDED